MIEVNIRDDGITVSGHARYAEPGRDIVCAAVSVLAQNVAESLWNLTADKIETGIRLGRVTINHGEYKNLSDKGKVLVDSFFMGIQRIADEYPDYVTINNGRTGTEAPGGADKASECSGRSGKDGNKHDDI